VLHRHGSSLSRPCQGMQPRIGQEALSPSQVLAQPRMDEPLVRGRGKEFSP